MLSPHHRASVCLSIRGGRSVQAARQKAALFAGRTGRLSGIQELKFE